MIPGISRSGATICTALYQNVEAEEAANFSFLMLLPAVLGATVLTVPDVLAGNGGAGIGPLFLGMLVAYLSGLVAIKMLLGVVRKGRLQYFAIYCFAIGLAGLLTV